MISSTNFMETLSGLATLRAFGWSNPAIVANHKLLDTSQRPMYLLAVVQVWLTTLLGLIVAILAILVVALATQLGANAGLVGASLVSLMLLGQFLANIVQNWTALELSIGAVARLNSFCDIIRSEDDTDETREPPKDWPKLGAVEIQNVSASYK